LPAIHLWSLQKIVVGLWVASNSQLSSKQMVLIGVQWVFCSIIHIENSFFRYQPTYTLGGIEIDKSHYVTPNHITALTI
jgi:hypothetical protein